MFVRKLDNAVFRKIDEDRLLALNMSTGEDFMYNETGRIFLEPLDGTVQNIEDLLPYIVSLYEDVSIEKLLPDYIEFLQGVESKGLVKLAEDEEELTVYKLKNVHVEITMKCNERCIHCYIPNCTKDTGESLPLEKFYHIVDEAKLLGVESITLSGGEPLLHRGGMAMLEYCKQKEITVNLFSNLLLLDEEHIAMLQSMSVGIVQASVYSMLPEVHDAITQRKGSLQRTLSSIKKLQDVGIEVQMACPVMQMNYKSVDLMLKYAKEHKLSLRLNSMLTAQTDGNVDFLKVGRLDLTQNKEMLCSLMECDSEYTYENLLELNDKGGQLYKNPKGFLDSQICSAGIDHCCISFNGKVYPCPDWESYCLGDINTQSLSEIWLHSKTLIRLRQLNKQKSRPECLECNLLSYCKRCFVQTGLENNGDILRYNQRLCDEVAVQKSVIDKYPNKNNAD